MFYKNTQEKVYQYSNETFILILFLIQYTLFPRILIKVFLIIFQRAIINEILENTEPNFHLDGSTIEIKVMISTISNKQCVSE